MNDVRRLTLFLMKNTDDFRIIHYIKKQIKYTKLLGDNNYQESEESNYKVYVKKTGKNYCIESNDLKNLENHIKIWLENLKTTQEYLWSEQDYQNQSTSEYTRNKQIYDNFSFEEYELWLNELSRNMTTKQTFQYYCTILKSIMISEKQTMEQYINTSQLLYYDTVKNNFVLKNDNVFCGEYPVEIVEYDTLNNIALSDVDFSLESINTLVSRLGNNFFGESIINNVSFITKEMFKKRVFDRNVDLKATPVLSYDRNGLQKKPSYLLENGVVTTFINSLESSIILNQNGGGNSLWLEAYELEGFVFELIVPFKKYKERSILIEQIEQVQFKFDSNEINTEIKCLINKNGEKYKTEMFFSFTDFMNNLWMDENYYFYLA